MDDEECLKVFKAFDRDFDGLLTPLELHQALGVCGGCPTIKEVEENLENDFQLTKADSQTFLTLLKKFRATVKTVESITALLQIVDNRKTGKINMHNIEFLLSNFNERLSTTEAKEFTSILKGQSEEKTSIAELAQKLARMQTE